MVVLAVTAPVTLVVSEETQSCITADNDSVNSHQLMIPTMAVVTL